MTLSCVIFFVWMFWEPLPYYKHLSVTERSELRRSIFPARSDLLFLIIFIRLSSDRAFISPSLHIVLARIAGVRIIAYYRSFIGQCTMTIDSLFSIVMSTSLLSSIILYVEWFQLYSVIRYTTRKIFQYFSHKQISSINRPNRNLRYISHFLHP